MNSSDTGFWEALDALVASSELKIDRPKGSRHPRWPEMIYSLDYGYLEGTTGGDGHSIDVWVGSIERQVTGAISTVDLLKRDAELKILLGCTPEEAAMALEADRSGAMSAVLLQRPAGEERPPWVDWTLRLAAIAQNGLAYAESGYDLERYNKLREIATEMGAWGSIDDAARIRGLFEREVGHATPKVDVRGVVFKDEAILLVKERADGLWTVPGGWADVGEAPAQGAAREVWEESGYTVRPIKLLALYDRNNPQHGHTPHPFHVYKVFYLCELTGGEARESIETEGVGFFTEDDLPPLSTGRVSASEIARFFEHLRNPDLHADFD